MALQTDAVDADAPGLDQLDDAEGAGVLGRAVLEVVVVVVELCGWVGGSGHAEGNGHVLFADEAEEDVVAVCAVFVEGCVCLCEILCRRSKLLGVEREKRWKLPSLTTSQ